MTPQQAAEILRKFQIYRYGKPPYEAPGAKFEHPPREITQAIDTALEAFEMAEFLEAVLADLHDESWEPNTKSRIREHVFNILNAYRKWKQGEANDQPN